MSKDKMTKEHTDRCPNCKQWWTRDILVDIPNDGMDIYLVKKDKDKYDLTIMLKEPILSVNAGDVFAIDDVSRAICDKLIVKFIQDHHKDNTFVNIYEDSNLSASTHRRRDSLSLSDPLSERSQAIVKKMRRKRRYV